MINYFILKFNLIKQKLNKVIIFEMKIKDK